MIAICYNIVKLIKNASRILVFIPSQFTRRKAKIKQISIQNINFEKSISKISFGLYSMQTILSMYILCSAILLLVNNTVMKLIPRFSFISLACLRSLVNTVVATMTLLFRLTSSSGFK